MKLFAIVITMHLKDFVSHAPADKTTAQYFEAGSVPLSPALAHCNIIAQTKHCSFLTKRMLYWIGCAGPIPWFIVLTTQPTKSA